MSNIFNTVAPQLILCWGSDSHWSGILCNSKVLNSTNAVPVLGGNPSCTEDVHAMLPLFSYSAANGSCRNYAISHTKKEAPGCVPTHDSDRCGRIGHALINQIMKQHFVGAFEVHDLYSLQLMNERVFACTVKYLPVILSKRFMVHSWTFIHEVRH